MVARAVVWLGGDQCEVLWLKPEGLPWQRFYLTVGFDSWDQYDQQRAFEDYQDVAHELWDVGACLGLLGKELLTVEAGFEETMGGRWLIRFADGSALRLSTSDPEDLNSDTHLDVLGSESGAHWMPFSDALDMSAQRPEPFVPEAD